MMSSALPETKAGYHDATPVIDAEIQTAMHEFMETFEIYRQSNEGRLSEIENRLSSDVVTSETLDRLDGALNEQKQRIDQLITRKNRPHLQATSLERSIGMGHEGRYKAAFETYIRRGVEKDLVAFQEKALSVGSDPDGGYLVPDETEHEIGRHLSEISPIRSIAGIRQVSGSVFKKPFSVTGPVVGWVGETDSRPQTAGPTLAELEFPTMELYAMPAATASLLEDSVINIDQWIADEVRVAFAEQEGAAFIMGDGNKKPNGLLNYSVIAENNWAWGKIGYLASGVDANFSPQNPADKLLDLIYALKAGYRQNAHWVMNRKTQAKIRKFKDNDGNYLWQPPSLAGVPATLMGFPIIEAEDMPDIGANAFPIAFGDFRRGYLIVDRMGMRVLRDPYSAKPYVLFYTTKRVGGGIQDFDAIKLFKTAAS